jgi:hypothetical protein
VPDIPVESISQIAIERFKREHSREGVKPATINRAVAMFKHFVGRAVIEGWVSASVARSVRTVTLLKESPGRVRYHSEEEARRLLGALRPEFGSHHRHVQGDVPGRDPRPSQVGARFQRQADRSHRNEDIKARYGAHRFVATAF